MDMLNRAANPLEVRVPDIGDFREIPVIELLVKPGDMLKAEQPVIILESDKSTLDVPTPIAGRVLSVAVVPGARVSQGSLILVLEVEKADEPQMLQSSFVAPQLFVPVESKGSSVGTVRIRDDGPPLESATDEGNEPGKDLETTSKRIYASPSIRRLGRELGADLAMVTGSGRGGRIVIEDVHQFVRKSAHPRSGPAAATMGREATKMDFSAHGEVERQPLSRIRRLSGHALARNWATIPHVTNFDEADVTDLETFRKELNLEMECDPKFTFISFLIKATATALRHLPSFNASLDGEELVLKKYVNVGFAVDTPAGLLVPVIRGVDRLGITAIAREVSLKGATAQAGKLKASDFEGGCFTISSLGGMGGTGFTPIINAPEIAILGVAKAAIKPVYDGAQFQPRLMLPLALSWDHRATDGVAAARFLAYLVGLLQDFRRVAL